MSNVCFWVAVFSLLMHLLLAFCGIIPASWTGTAMLSVGALLVSAIWRVEQVTNTTFNQGVENE